MASELSLETLYRAAQAEGGGLDVYAGGDSPAQAAIYRSGFETAFPDIDLRITVDLSKYHNARIDHQHAVGDVVVDVVHLQTLDDFPYWRSEGWLAPFKPTGFAALPPDLCDKDGHYYPILAFGFSNVVDTAVIDERDAPRDASDYLRADLKDRLVLTYPHDDDAVLYQFDQLLHRHGWGWLEALIAQNPTWVRGTQTPLEMIAAGEKVASFTTFYYLRPEPASTIRFLLPRSDFFQSWYQLAAILRSARHPAAARLYVSHLLSEGVQASVPQWPARLDIAPPPGFRHPLEYANTSPIGFRAFLANRARIDRLKGLFEQWLGPVTGPNPTGVAWARSSGR